MTRVLERDGVLVRPNILSRGAVRLLHGAFDRIGCERAGSRSFNLSADIDALIGRHGPLGAIAAQESEDIVRPVRVLFFDKTPASNWGVPWHQDRTIAVKTRHDVAGFGPWSVKDGIDHVEPPIAILEGMITLRLFVDDCDNENGPLEVAVGSHRFRRLPAHEMTAVVRGSTIFVGAGRAGDVLVMKTLAVHSSKRARSPAHRRVLHVDYAANELPAPLEWMLGESAA